MSETEDQGSDKSPSQFYEHLCEAFCSYTPENHQMINTTFVDQAQGDIRWKSQKLEGFAGINASQLLEVATKVFVKIRRQNRSLTGK
jgi:hypothetical protein